MSFLHVKDFRFGWDTRKNELALRPGTLEIGENVLINQGGEVTNRKAWVPTATAIPAGCFGLQATSLGWYTFGSAATPAGFPNLNMGTGPIPIYLNYQRLQHVAVLAGTAYDGAKHAMTGVVFSELYAGYPMVVATFADGRSYVYYGIPSSAGVPVYDFTDGLVLPDRATTALIATDIIALLNRSGRFTATSPGASQVNIEGPKDQPYDLAITEDSAGGITNTKLSDPVSSTLGVQAIGSFYVTGGSSSAGVNKITLVTVGAAGSPVTITNSTVDWTTSNIATAALIAASINAKTSSPEYTADSTGNQVIISAALAQGATPNDFVVITNTAGNFCVGDYRATFQGTKFSVDSFFVDGVDILGGAITYGPGNTHATLTALVAAITTAINAGTTAGAAHGYLTFASNNVLFFSKAVSSSANADITAYFVLTVPSGFIGTVLYDNPVDQTGFTVSAQPDVFNMVSYGQFIAQSQGSPTVDVVVYTPNAPQLYTYSWRKVSGPNLVSSFGVADPFNCQATSPNERTTKFSITAHNDPQGFVGVAVYVFVCDVTDINSFTVTSNTVTINVAYRRNL